MKTSIRGAEWVLALVMLFCVAMLLALPFIATIRNEWFPVKSGWIVTNAEVDGRDILLRGTFIKHFDCEYIDPPGAIDVESGDPLWVESYSKGKKKSYPARPEPYPFGVWRIQDGVGKKFDIYQNDRCSVGGMLITRLGQFDARTMTQTRTGS